MTLSDDQLRQAADIFEIGLDKLTNPELPTWNPLFAGSDLPFTFEELADSIISMNKGEETDEDSA